MSLVEFFPPTGTGGGGASTSANNTWTGTNDFAGLLTANGMNLAIQSIVLAGGSSNTTTIGANTGSPSLVIVSGTAATTQTLNMPASPATGDFYMIRWEGSGSVSLAGNGVNIEGSSSIGATVSSWVATLAYDGSQWRVVGFTTLLGYSWNNGTQAFNGSIILSSSVRPGNQSFATNGGTIGTVSASSGMFVLLTGTSGGTLNLPSSPSSNMILAVKDTGGGAGSSNITVSGNGKSIDGGTTAVISTNYGAVRLYYNGTQWYSW